ncbi:MAG: flagellar motor protein MotB [Proteobacteria bacterium]|nr:MAG: flagellar motor protein MotB [Pseudomonadota bacterium]
MKTQEDNNQSFWISYADLMAGLLFVFILLIGAIVVKYVYTQSSLSSKEQQLQQKNKAVSQISNQLATTKDALKVIKILLAQEQEKNVNAAQDIKIKTEELILLKDQLLNANEDLKNQKNLAQDLNAQLIQKGEELAQSREDFIKSQNELAQSQKDLNQSRYEIGLTKNELAKITQKLLESASENQRIIEDLNITKARIQNLTGIRIKAIKILKKKLGSDIAVDEKSGAIRLPSAVLFDVNSYKVKEKSKEGLRKTLTKYINTLLEDEQIRNYIESIVIEGYTDSQGSYLYNLQLSQKRAFSVLEFLYTQKGINKDLLKKYLSASGQSYNNVILKNGKEDKEASRRIEIKFNISNKKAIKEIDTYLKGKYN